MSLMAHNIKKEKALTSFVKHKTNIPKQKENPKHSGVSPARGNQSKMYGEKCKLGGPPNGVLET